MARSIRVKSTNEANMENLAGLGFLGIFLIIFILPATGYLIYMFKTPWKFKIFKEYDIQIDRTKNLKIISIILTVLSSIIALFTIINDSSYTIVVAVISIIFLIIAMDITKDERENIKQVKDFLLEYDTLINKKEAIMQQTVSNHNRNSDKYNSILKDETDDIMQKIKNKFNFSSAVLEKIAQNTLNTLKEF